MCPDKQFNVKQDPAAARLAAKNKKLRENPQKTWAPRKRIKNGEKG